MDPSRDLDRIVSELNARPESESDEASDTAPLDRWLAVLLAKGGSDLLLVPGAPVCILHEGGVRNLESEPLNGSEIEAIVLPALTPHALQQYRAGQIADSSYRIASLGRFRINLHRERGQAAAAIRALPSKVPQLSDLHLPTSVEALSHLQRGLVLIGGPAGS